MKAQIEENLKIELQKYFSEIQSLIDSAEKITISQNKKKKTSTPVFIQGETTIKLPANPGIYLVYRTNDESPFYCGETGNLKTRLEYHFSNRKDAIEYSTLKKCFYDPNDRTMLAMADMLYLKIIEVPFCRWDVEEFFHKKYNINTKKVRKKSKTKK
jgi:predicted GIY-YIG superfamily endonuclease